MTDRSLPAMRPRSQVTKSDPARTLDATGDPLPNERRSTSSMAEIRRVALIHSRCKLTGGVKRIFNVAHPLAERGYRVTLYSPSLEVPSWSDRRDLTDRSLEESLGDETDCAIFFNPKYIPYRYLARSPTTHKVIYFLLNGGHYKQSYERWCDITN